jgi:NAD(P)-dependent dehydrogenase (short-subunit alcohol dehydrogenase family)
MRSHHAFVTGANRGLGLETARRLAARGWRVILAARRAPEGTAAAAALAAHGADVRCWPLDLADPAGAAVLAARAGAEALRIDALVHNAGVYPDRVDDASVREVVEVNVLGPARLTDALAPHLVRGARVVMVSSEMGQRAALPADLRAAVDAVRSRADLERLAGLLAGRTWDGAGRSLVYSASKAALNALARVLAGELAPRGVLVNAVCPGWVRTAMGGAGAPRTVEEGAAGIVWAATLPPDAPTGRFFKDGRPIPW